MINILLFFIGLIMLVIAAEQDILKREVDDKVWEIFGFIGFIATALLVGLNTAAWLQFTIALLITTGAMFLLSYAGEKNKFLFFGGADLKAIAIMSVFLWTDIFMPLKIFLGALILSLMYPLNIIFFNFVHQSKLKGNVWEKIVLALTAFPKKISKLEVNPYFSPMEEINVKRVNGSWREQRGVRLFPLIEPEKEIIRLKELVKKRRIKDIVFVSPLPPFMIFILASYIMAFITTL